MNGKKPYFPNNWDEYSELPDNFYIPHTFEEVMTWKIAGWELPSSVCCIIRASDVKTKKVKEYVYQHRGHAQRMINRLMVTPGIEFTVADHEAIHFLSSEQDV